MSVLRIHLKSVLAATSEDRKEGGGWGVVATGGRRNTPFTGQGGPCRTGCRKSCGGGAQARKRGKNVTPISSFLGTYGRSFQQPRSEITVSGEQRGTRGGKTCHFVGRPCVPLAAWALRGPQHSFSGAGPYRCRRKKGLEVESFAISRVCKRFLIRT